MACWRPTQSCVVKSFRLRQSRRPSPQTITLMPTDAPCASVGPGCSNGLRHRHRTLPELRHCLEDHCRDRRSADDCQNPHPSGPTHPRPAACPGAAIRSVPNNLRAKTGCQRNPSRRRANRAPPATAPPELAGAKPRFSLFSLNSFTIDTLGGTALYISVRKKGCLNFLFKFPIQCASCRTSSSAQ
jgi:hypothetical protein